MREIDFGLWYDFRNPPRWRISFQDLYRQCLEQMKWAESLGFDSVWLTEHHFCEDGYTPSPMVIAGAIGQATGLRIGTNLLLLPLADPVCMAEDAATLSLLTGGRFDLGVGLGYRQLEFEYFGRSLKNRPSLMEEGIDVIRQAWSDGPVNVQGKRYRIEDLDVTPKPEILPKLYVGGMSEPAIARAARLGDGFLSAGGTDLDSYIAALEALGRDRAQGAIVTGSWAIIAPDPEAELAKLEDHILYQINNYVAWGAFGPPDEVPPFADARSAVDNAYYEIWDADMAVAALTRMLLDYPEIEVVHFWARFPGESIESASARVEYIAERVLPAVRANVAGD